MSAIFDTPIQTNAQHLERVLAAGRPTVLVFETDNCEPCRAIQPALKDLARAFAGEVLIVRVEEVTEGDLMARFRLERAPTLIFRHDDGREVARIEGAASAADIRKHLEHLLDQRSRPAVAGGPSVALPGAQATAAHAQTGPAQTAPPARDAEPLVVSDATFQSQVLQSSLPVLVDFWAPWCGPCRMVSPIVEQLGREYAGRLRVAKVNTDDNPAWANRLGIRGIPTLIFFKGGREVDRVVGAAPKAMLQSRAERVLNAA
jgi:thioredoxin 1